ncbi:MAG: stimulus-sensing domain-containing protein [Pseudomonadota bacterium]
MASDTATKRPEGETGRPADPPQPSALARLAARARPYIVSQLTVVIVAVNAAALLVLVAGMFVITENQRGLIRAKQDSLTAQGDIIRNVIVQTAVIGAPAPRMNNDDARQVLAALFVPPETRALIHDRSGLLVADSQLQAGRVGVEVLPPPGENGGLAEHAGGVFDWIGDAFLTVALPAEERAARERTLREEVLLAIDEAQPIAGVRRGPNGRRVVSVTLPIQNVQAVVGAVTYESYDLDALVVAERMAIIPYVIFALVISIALATALTVYIAAPLRRLADAARQVRLAGGRRVPLPRMRGRKDEIGALGNAFSDMTEALYDRLDAIESFAADVAHEIKNPLTSIRSAAEVLPRARDDEKRARLIELIQLDVKRLDRLVTDISNASRLDAELAREDLTPVDLARLLGDISSTYENRAEPRAHIRLATETREPLALAHEGPLSRVFMNLLDNALTFSPEGGEVEVRVQRSASGGRGRLIVTIEDEGPGIPPENLETIFERFYTQRPVGAAFGSHSGLGLAIARQIVRAHGGRIFATNCTGPAGEITGARFTVELPALVS